MKNHTRLKISERLILLRIVDLILILLMLNIYNTWYNVPYLANFGGLSDFNTLSLLAVFLFLGQVFELYNLRATSSRYLTIKNLFITTIVTLFVFLFIPYVTPTLPENRIEIIILFLIIFFPVFIWRNIYILTVANKFFYKRIFIIGGNDTGVQELVTYIQHYAKDHQIVGYSAMQPIDGLENYYPLTADIDDILSNHQIKEVLVSLRGFQEVQLDIINKNLIHFFEKGINIVGFQDFIEKLTYCVPKQNLNKHFYKYFNFSEQHENRLYLLMIRIIDIIGAFLGLFFLTLIVPFVYVLNKIANRGPLFYKQERVGLNGVIFKIVKLRSMVINAEINGAQWAQKNDHRITPFGKVLRKSRLDEIPQFWNVLIGHMSLIGPRPERPEFVIELENKLPFYAIRHVIKPGLTGWAQVMQPYASTLEEQEKKLRYDLYYIKKRSLFLDFKIVIKTIHTVLYFRGN